jgi:hypothetical protein
VDGIIAQPGEGEVGKPILTVVRAVPIVPLNRLYPAGRRRGIEPRCRCRRIWAAISVCSMAAPQVSR